MTNRFTHYVALILLFISGPVLTDICFAKPPRLDVSSYDSEYRVPANPITGGASIEISSSGYSGSGIMSLQSSGEKKSAEGSKEFIVPSEQSLAGLFGKTEIKVRVDVDSQFIDTMAEHQILEGDLAKHVEETTLDESILTGRQFSRESHAAKARVAQARAQSAQALGLLLPTLHIRANRGFERSEPSVEADPLTGELSDGDSHIRSDVTLTITQPVFDLASSLDWQRRKVVETAREENFRVSDGDAYLATVNTYMSLVASRLQSDLIRDFESQLGALLEYIEKRSEAGASSVSDMARVRARSQATRSSRLEQEAAHLAAGTEFVRLTNLTPRIVQLPDLQDVGGEVLPNSFERAVPTAMRLNPELAALVAEWRAAGIDRSVAKGSYLPRIDAEYTDSYSRHAGGSDETQRDRRIMMVLNWDILSGGRDHHLYLERAARYKELQFLLDDRRRQVVQSLAANYATLATTRERIVTGYQELESIATAAKAMSKRMLSGNQSLLDLLEVYDRYFQVRSRLVTLHVLEINTVAQLIRLTRGAPWPAGEGHPPIDNG